MISVSLVGRRISPCSRSLTRRSRNQRGVPGLQTPGSRPQVRPSAAQVLSWSPGSGAWSPGNPLGSGSAGLGEDSDCEVHRRPRSHCRPRCHRPAGSTPDVDAGSGTDTSCTRNNGGCDPSTACLQWPGSRLCICKPWMQGNGLTCTPTGLQEGSPWPVEGGNVQHTGQSPFLAAQTNERVRRLRLGPEYSFLWASVVIDADGTLYASGGDGALLALDPGTAFSGGPPKWSYLPETSAVDPWGTPAVAKDGLIYAPYFHGFYALDPAAKDSSARVWWAVFEPSPGDADDTSTLGPGITLKRLPTIGSG
jgi:hypothetical protein